MEPHRPLGASLPLALRIHRASIHEAIVDVARVEINRLDTGPIQWCGLLLVLHPPDTPTRGVAYNDFEAGLAPRERYALTITVAADNLSTSREFILEPGKPRYTFVARQ
jgi:hypothetical protein